MIRLKDILLGEDHHVTITKAKDYKNQEERDQAEKAAEKDYRGKCIKFLGLFDHLLIEIDKPSPRTYTAGVTTQPNLSSKQSREKLCDEGGKLVVEYVFQRGKGQLEFTGAGFAGQEGTLAYRELELKTDNNKGDWLQYVKSVKMEFDIHNSDTVRGILKDRRYAYITYILTTTAGDTITKKFDQAIYLDSKQLFMKQQDQYSNPTLAANINLLMEYGLQYMWDDIFSKNYTKYPDAKNGGNTKTIGVVPYVHRSPSRSQKQGWGGTNPNSTWSNMFDKAGLR